MLFYFLCSRYATLWESGEKKTNQNEMKSWVWYLFMHFPSKKILDSYLLSFDKNRFIFVSAYFVLFTDENKLKWF